MLLATSLGAWGQTSDNAPATPTLSTVVIEGRDNAPAGKYSLRATDTQLGKGRQALRDIPQTLTVMTERLMDDRNLDDFREVLKSTAGITFLAGKRARKTCGCAAFLWPRRVTSCEMACAKAPW